MCCPNCRGYDLDSHERNDLQLACQRCPEETYPYSQEEEEQEEAAKDQAQGVKECDLDMQSGTEHLDDFMIPKH